VKRDFDETLQAKSRDPLDAPDADLVSEWEQLYHALDGDLPDGERDKQLEEVIIRLLRLLVPVREGRLYPRSLGLRLLALAWVLRPDFFEGNPSLRELARRANVTPAKLSRHTGRFSRLLRWRNRAQRHAWNWIKGQRSPLV
jgi:hypothetical protein